MCGDGAPPWAWLVNETQLTPAEKLEIAVMKTIIPQLDWDGSAPLPPHVVAAVYGNTEGELLAGRLLLNLARRLLDCLGLGGVAGGRHRSAEGGLRR